ncbi:unnamed protein product, partial [Ceratitis capitata]
MARYYLFGYNHLSGASANKEEEHSNARKHSLGISVTKHGLVSALELLTTMKLRGQSVSHTA